MELSCTRLAWHLYQQYDYIGDSWGETGDHRRVGLFTVSVYGLDLESDQDTASWSVAGD